MEPLLDTDRDRLFTLDLVNGEVHLREQPWAKLGDVVNWLVSESFGLEQGRSIEAHVGDPSVGSVCEHASLLTAGEGQLLSPRR